MSNHDSHAPEHDDSLSHGYGPEHDYGQRHGSFKSYLTGFVLAAILTAIPFWLVMGHVIASDPVTVIIVLALGVAQLYVHLVYFLHIDTSQEGGWTLMGTCFTIILVFIVLVGSIWVMNVLHGRMMMMPMTG